jgi:hypothetical protein
LPQQLVGQMANGHLVALCIRPTGARLAHVQASNDYNVGQQERWLQCVWFRRNPARELEAACSSRQGKKNGMKNNHMDILDDLHRVRRDNYHHIAIVLELASGKARQPDPRQA